jgi:hypothetical protein
MLGVVAAAATAGAVGAPAPLRDLLSVVAGAVFLWSVGHRVGQNDLDALAVAVSGALVALVLIGMALGAVPGGIDRIGWFLGVGVVEAAVIVALRPGPGALPRAGSLLRRVRPRHLWYPAGAALAVTAIAVSVAASRTADLPPLSLSVTAAHDGAVTVEVASAHPSGPLDLVLTDGGDTDVVLSDFAVSAHASRSVVVALPVAGRSVLELTSGGTVRRQIVVVP